MHFRARHRLQHRQQPRHPSCHSLPMHVQTLQGIEPHLLPPCPQTVQRQGRPVIFPVQCIARQAGALAMAGRAIDQPVVFGIIKGMIGQQAKTLPPFVPPRRRLHPCRQIFQTLQDDRIVADQTAALKQRQARASGKAEQAQIASQTDRLPPDARAEGLCGILDQHHMRGNALQQHLQRRYRGDMPAEMGRYNCQSLTADQPRQHAQIEIEPRLSGVAQAHAQTGPMRRHRHFGRCEGRQDHLAPQRALFEIFESDDKGGKARIDHHNVIGSDRLSQMAA